MMRLRQHASSIAGPIPRLIGGTFPALLLSFALLSFALALWNRPASGAESATAVPAPIMDAPARGGAASETAVLAGGCFWGVQAVFQHVNGVNKVLSGYSGGSKDAAAYDIVSSGRTGHAEAVEIEFDPNVITYGKILQIYFSAAHDPTERDRQGPDVGRQYRSAIFVNDDAQRRVAEAYIAQIDKSGVFTRPIATQINQLTKFYPAESYHQDYATLHPNDPYIAYNDRPKVENLKRLFPVLFRATPVTVSRPMH